MTFESSSTSPMPSAMPSPADPAIVADDRSSVRSFYTGASVLVTGGTGFLGKVLIEKLLWACPDVNAIYVLVRNKKGVKAKDRINTLLSSQDLNWGTSVQCFDRLRESRGPGFGSKLVPVQGDIAEDRLGLSDLDHDLLSRHVSIVFHVAATIRFNEPFHVAVAQNVRGTKELLSLCRTCPELKAVVHVSTAYSHCPLPCIEERFYDAPMDCDEAIRMAAEGELTPAMTNQLLGPWPNTYSFTKALAEEVVRKHGQGLPVCVYRPAIVISSMNEPVEGWVDSMGGPGVALAGVLTGFIRVMPANHAMEAALVPCDMVVDGMIAAAWDLATKSASSATPIYNFTPSQSNGISWLNYFVEYAHRSREMPSSRTIWTPNAVAFTSSTMVFLFRVVLQYLPAAIVDGAFLLTGRKPFVSRLYGKINTALDASAFFVTREWIFQEKNVPALCDRLSPQDKEVFNFDMRTLDWDIYAKKTSPGIRKFILKEDPSTIPAARSRYQRILTVQLLLKIFIYFMAMYAIFTSVFGFSIFGLERV